MDTQTDCVSCFLRQAGEVARFATDDDAVRATMTAEARRITASADLAMPPVALGQRVHRMLRATSGDPDPYRPAKSRYNRLVTELVPELRAMIDQALDPLAVAVRLAIAANVIDFAAHGDLTATEVLVALRAAAGQPLHADLAAFRAALATAERVLYLTDNAGEIAVDRLLIERIGPRRVTVAVRGGAVINDATRADADEVGLPGLVEVIDNGSDAPGTLLADCSQAFLARFAAADLIIAKGQGNYESLIEVPRPIFLLFKVKCAVVAEHAGLPLGSHALLPATAGQRLR